MSVIYSTVALASLLIQETKEAIYKTGIGIASAIGVPVSTWEPGDPTRSLFHLEAEVLAELEKPVVGFIEAGFLDDAKGDWLKAKAEQDFNVLVPAATQATTDVVLTNNKGRLFEDIEPGGITFRNSLTGKTYTNTTGGTLASGPGTTLTVTVVADEPGSESSAGAGEIDEIVTTMLGVTCTNPIAAVGTDEQEEETTRQQCRDKLSALSPNGPKGAYSYVARSPELTGTTAITRVREYGDSDTGDVTVYLAGPSGAVSEIDRAKVELGIATWATPLCITPLVLSASNVLVPITYELWLYRSVNKTAAEVAEEVEAALEQMLAEKPIGGDVIPPNTGKLYHSMIESTIREVFPDHAFRVLLTTPSADVDLTSGQVAALGTVTATIHLVVTP